MTLIFHDILFYQLLDGLGTPFIMTASEYVVNLTHYLRKDKSGTNYNFTLFLNDGITIYHSSDNINVMV